ncbi:hypothetical protein DRQ00_09260 [candidate division KSB1 bacterium]|nr:MAG: hypothetical protein DRQ00_09260 [candidate division KSB1 bacterium]
MKTNFKSRLGLLARTLTLIFVLSVEVFAQQFPIGVYWVRKEHVGEGDNYYDQVAECGFNIIVGGYYFH